MAINAYCGLMGSGKSYEAVSSVILPAIAAGRRIVSNIDGLNEALIHEYILANRRKFSKKADLTVGELGAIVHVANERILEPKFFPDPEHADGLDSVVKPGDLVVIDEAWRFWPKTGVMVSHEHKQFFKMHRHYAHPETGVTCDLSLIIQDISGLFQDLKTVIEMTCKTSKLKAVGMPSRYRVEVFEGYRLTRTAKTGTYQKKYDKKIFPLYKSYGSDNANEQVIDGRQNIFNRGKLWIIAILVVLFWGVGGTFFWRFLSGETTPAVVVAESVKKPNSGVDQVKSAAMPEVEKKAKSELSETWRIAGSTMIDERPYVVLQNAAGRLRYEHVSNFENRGVFMRGIVDGDNVTTYSGRSEGLK